MHQRPLRFLLIFLLVFLAGDRLLSRALEGLVTNSEFRYSRLYRGAAMADVLILGDSRGVHSFFAPRLEQDTCMSVFNLSFNGMPIRGSECLLLDYLERHPVPKLIVLEVTSVQASSSSIDGLRPYLAHSDRLRALYASLFPKSSYGVRVSNLYQFNCEMFFRVCYYLHRSDQSWIMTSRINDELVAQSESEVTCISLDSPEWIENLAALTRISVIARERNIRLQLVIAPYLPSYRRNIQNWPMVVQALSQSVAGRSISDYSLALTNTGQFADRMHLNDKGAEAFGAILKRDHFFELNQDFPHK